MSALYHIVYVKTANVISRNAINSEIVLGSVLAWLTSHLVCRFDLSLITSEIDVDLIPSDEYALRTISMMSNMSIRDVIKQLQSEQVYFNSWNMGTTGVKCLSYLLNSLY